MQPRITLTAKGGGDEIGGSLYDYMFNDELIRIDSGQRPSNFNSDIRCLKVIGNKKLEKFLDQLLVKPKIDPLPECDTTADLKHLFLTHGHLDHVGVVPYVLRKQRHATVYATPITAKICEIQWNSALVIANRNSEIPLFNESDIGFALSRIRLIYPRQRIRVNDNLEIEPIEAGHLLGAVSFIFYWNDKPIGFHTGDFTARNKQRLVADAPELKFDQLRFMTAESTKITEQNSPRNTEEDRFKDLIHESYSKGMWIRILTFAIGRLQEMFVLCKESCPDADIWIDGQGRDVSTIFEEHTGGALAGIKQHFVNNKYHRHAIIHSKKQNIVLSPSAMQFGGTSRRYIEYGCARSDHLFISPGYREHSSPEYVFFEAPCLSVFRFGAVDIPKLCQTATFNFTSHCDGKDVLELQDRMNPKQTALVHGEHDRMTQFIANHPKQKFVLAENNKTIQF